MVYKCERCGVGEECFCIGPDMPNQCSVKGFIEGSKWQPTDEYEIIKKPTPPKSEEELQDRNKVKVHYFDTKEEADAFMEKRIDPVLSNQTPNCSICEWSETREGKQLFTNSKIPVHACSAQAWKVCCNVYDNENCKSLFKPKSGAPEIDNDEDSRPG